MHTLALKLVSTLVTLLLMYGSGGLLRVVLLDRFGNTVFSDSASTCTITATASGVYAQLYYPATYAVVNGIADISPFRVDKGSGVSVDVVVTCASGITVTGLVVVDRLIPQVGGQRSYPLC